MFHRVLTFAASLALLVNMSVFGGLAFAQNSTGATATTPFEGTHWTLTEVAGQQVSPPEGRQAAYLQFAAEGNRVTGSTGCNRLAGSYEKNGSSLKFHPIATTMMACVGQGMERESKFNDALSKTTRYRIKGSTLVLLDEKTVLARFKAQPEDQTKPTP